MDRLQWFGLDWPVEFGAFNQISFTMKYTVLATILLLIMLLSVGAVALVIEHVMTIRAPVLMPPGLADDVRELLADLEAELLRLLLPEASIS